MNLGVSKIFVITLLWFTIITIQILFPDSIGGAKNNGYYVVLSGIICFILCHNGTIALLSISIFMILVLFSNDILHPVSDFARILMILSSLMIAIRSRFLNSERFLLFVILSAFIVADVLGMAFSSFYGIEDSDRPRYIGILHGSNYTATIFCLAQIAIYELKIKQNNKRRYLYINFFLFVLMFIGTRTRSLLFFLPYWISHLYSNMNKKLFICLCIIVGVFLLKSIADIASSFRLEEDGSFITRMYLYRNLFDGIKQNYFLIPHGSNSANLFSKLITGDDDYAAHNDVLLYLYDWGVIFVFLLIYSCKKIISNVTNINWKYFLIVLAWCSACLHNVLMMPTVFLLFIIASNLYFSNISMLKNSVSVKYTPNINQ